MLPPVLEDVDQAVADGTRRGGLPRVKPVSPHRTRAAQDAVDGLRDADHQALTASDESRRAVGLDQEMDVIVPDTEVEHAKGRPGARVERAPNRVEHWPAA